MKKFYVIFFKLIMMIIPSITFGNVINKLNLLYLSKKYCQKSVFIYSSTNKVYGDLPNELPLVEKKKRYEINIIAFQSYIYKYSTY